MTKNYIFYIKLFVYLFFFVEIVTAKTWLSPEVIDDADSADGLGAISASITQNRNLYVTWENVIEETAPHSYNLFWKLRYRSFAWSDTHQLTHHPFDVVSGAIYPDMDSNSGFFTGDNVYVTYSSSGEGYLLRHMATGDTSVIDASVCGTSGNGAAFAAEEPHDYHVVYLQCPERRLYHKKFTEPPADHGWGASTVLTEAGRTIFSYDIAVDHDRAIHVVWSEHTSVDPPRTNLHYLKHTEAGGWDAAPTLLSVATTITGVRVEAGTDGNVHVVWREIDLSDHPTEDIFYKTWRGGVWSDDRNLSSGDEHSHHPSMTVTGDNNVHVAWIAADRTIAYRKWDGDWQAIVHLSAGSASQPFLTADSSRNLYLLYSAPKPPSPTATRLMLIRYAEPSAHTPEGSDVRVAIENHTITFDQVTENGVTTIASSSEGADLSADFMQSCTPPQYFNIETTATYRAPIDICLTYDERVCDETELQLLHNLGDRWVDITTSVDTDANLVCGRILGGLSEFTLARPASSVPGEYPHWTRIGIIIAALLIVLLGMVFWRSRRP